MGNKPILDQMDFGEAFNQRLARRSSDAWNRLQTAVESGLTALERNNDAAALARLRSAWALRNPVIPAIMHAAEPGRRIRPVSRCCRSSRSARSVAPTISPTGWSMN